MNREELIQQMLEAHDGTSDLVIASRKGMAAALDVVLGEVLEEIAFHRFGASVVNFINVELASRRTKYAKAKTPEERVTIEPCEGQLGHYSHVLLDGRAEISLLLHKDAEIYRLGLIAQLKEGK